MSTSTSTTGTTVSTPVIIPIDTPTLGDRSYLAHDGQVAVVIDPQRDIDRVLALADRGRRARSPTCSRPTSTTTT